MIELYAGRTVEELKRDETALTDALRQAGGDVKGRIVRCCFCDDHRPSGGIYQTEAGGYRYKCQKCDFNGSIIDVMAKIEGIEPIAVLRRLGGRSSARPAKSPKVYPNIDELKAAMPGTVESVYQYTDPISGGLNMLVLRTLTNEGKTFRQARPIAGGFVFEAPAKPLPIYNCGCIHRADTVLVVEGEKCVHALHEYGITATTSPGGAKNAHNADWSPLGEKNVILWPDYDAAGEKYIEDATQSLASVEPAPRLSFIDPADLDLAEGEDAADFIEQLEITCKDRSEIQAALSEILNKAKPKGFAAEVAEGIEEAICGNRRVIKTPWSMLDHLSRALLPDAVCMLAGNPSASKSFMVLQILSHAIDGGIKSVVYELEESRQHHLFRALAQQSGVAGMTDAEWIEANPEIARHTQSQCVTFLDVIGRSIHVCPDSQVTLSQIVDWIEKQAKTGFKLIIIDPLSAADHSRWETWAEDATFIQRVKRVAVEYRVCVLIVHHPVKAVSCPELGQLSGGAAFGRFIQCILWLEAHDEKTGQVKTCCGTGEATYNRTLHVLKARNAKGSGCRLAMTFRGDTLTFSEHGLIVKREK